MCSVGLQREFVWRIREGEKRSRKLCFQRSSSYFICFLTPNREVLHLVLIVWLLMFDRGFFRVKDEESFVSDKLPIGVGRKKQTLICDYMLE